MQFITAALSKEGGRKNNEDYLGYIKLDKGGCWAAADGLGGHEAGEIASMTAVEAVLEAFKVNPDISPKAIRSYLEEAQRRVVECELRSPSYSNMRTTLAVMITDYINAIWAHIGDSRLYYFCCGKLEVQTKDHSVPQALVNAGEISAEEIRYHEDRNKLLRVLGDKDDFRPSFSSLRPVTQGDSVLMCTDGFWEHVTEEQMEAALYESDTPAEWLKKMEQYIKLCTQNKASHDNYSALAIYIR